MILSVLLSVNAIHQKSALYKFPHDGYLLKATD